MRFSYKGYIGKFSYESQVYYGRLLLINKDVVTFQGKNLLETYLEFKKSVEDYLEFLQDLQDLAN